MQTGTLSDLYHSTCLGKSEAILLSDENNRYSGNQVWEAINAIAEGYLALGMKKGDIVSFLCTSSVKQALAYFACQLIGAIPCCLHARETNARLVQNIEFVEARFLIADDNNFQTAHILKHSSSIEFSLIAVGPDLNDATGTDSLAAEYSGAMDCTNVDADDLGALLMSSGTTGPPKAVLHSHRTLIANALAGPQIYGNCYSHDSVIVIMPPSFAAWAFTVLPFIAAKGRVHFSTWSTPVDFLNIIEKEHISVVPLVPTIWRMVLNTRSKDHDLSCVSSVFYSGEPGSPKLVEDLSKHICSDVRTAYLASEIGCAAGIVADINILNRPGKAASTGQPADGADARIVEPSYDNLIDVPINTVGEIIIRGASVSSGYLKNKIGSRKQFVDGWWRSRDLGRIDEEGMFHVHGRLDNRINTGGIKVHAEEVETGLLSHPQVQAAAVVGEPHALWGEQIVAHIISEEAGLSAENIIDFCREHDLLPTTKLPKKIHFHENLPSGPTGKILRRALRQTVDKEQSARQIANTNNERNNGND